MELVTVGRRSVKYLVGTVSALALVQACDAGSSTSFDEPDPMGGVNAGGAFNLAGGGQVQGGAAGLGGVPSAGATNGGAPAAGTTNGGAANAGTAGSSAAGAGGGTGEAGGGGLNEGGAGGGGAGGEPHEGGAGGEPHEGGHGGAGGLAGEGSGGDGPSCQRVLVGSKPRASKVMLLMDRSGTMFEPPQQPAWPAVRDALLPVIDTYDGLVDVGFMAMTGEMDSCPLLDEVAPAANNYAAVSAKYLALAKPTKGESPFMLALSRAQQLLDAAPAGEPYVIFVIDGQPDYCDDGNDVCAIDSVVSRLQELREAGITTLVGSLPIYPGANAERYAAAVQAYANAGVGVPAGCVTPNVSDTHYQCNMISPGWTAEFAAGTKPAPQALADYSSTPGTAGYEALVPDDTGALAASFGRLFARTLSCKLDLAGGAKIDAAQAAQGVLKLDGQAVPYDASNGWRLNAPSEVELVGSACDTWRGGTKPKKIALDFPCAAVSY